MFCDPMGLHGLIRESLIVRVSFIINKNYGQFNLDCQIVC
jgi:hypothetical protein